MPDPHPTPSQIRSAIQAAGISQLELGRRLKVSGRTVRRWVAGTTRMPAAAAMALAGMAKRPGAKAVTLAKGKP